VPGLGSPPEPTPDELPPTELGSAPPAATTTPFRFFSPTSFWNESLPATTSLDADSQPIVASFAELVESEELDKEGPWINTTEYGLPVYVVPGTEATVPVKLDDASNPALTAAWSAVPLPVGAKPAAGTDGDLFLWQPSTERLWEFWRLVHSSEGWEASWGGAMQHVLSSPGVYGTEAWPGAQSWWGISASSLSLVGGMISIEDLERKQINHALAMAIPGTRAGVFAAPAQRTDGKDDSSLALPEGAHLRLNPNLDLADLHLPPFTLMLAEAAQRYGIFVTDSSPIVELYAQDPAPTGSNPYSGPHGFFSGESPNQLLADFPWRELELVRMELHSAS
jgi:hypothetical protein